MQFLVRALRQDSNAVEVRYDCECGCKPRARYHRGADEANYEHCCCGRVHFVGMRAEARLRAYLEERRARGEDADVGGYELFSQSVAAPWAEAIPVAYALPLRPRKH